jgi:hypothetical protein
VDPSLDSYREIWLADFEFIAEDGERPRPVCLVAWELRTGRKIHLWRNEFSTDPPYPTDPGALFVAFQAQAELSCHLVLGWPQPASILDLYVEYRWLTNGLFPASAVSLLKVLNAFGLSGITGEEKELYRNLVLQGGPWSWPEREAILAYCETDVKATAELLDKLVPSLDLPHALLRGRYMHAAACMEHVGIPFDIAGCILSESIIIFLGFGDPKAFSW